MPSPHHVCVSLAPLASFLRVCALLLAILTSLYGVVSTLPSFLTSLLLGIAARSLSNRDIGQRAPNPLAVQGAQGSCCPRRRGLHEPFPLRIGDFACDYYKEALPREMADARRLRLYGLNEASTRLARALPASGRACRPGCRASYRAADARRLRLERGLHEACTSRSRSPSAASPATTTRV